MSRKILVAEDDDGIAFTLTETLSKAGYDVVLATDGRQAMRLLDHEIFDLLITDLDMPNADGIEVLQHLRASGNKMPAILYTASLHMTEELALQSGATALVEKGDPYELLAVVESLLSNE